MLIHLVMMKSMTQLKILSMVYLIPPEMMRSPTQVVMIKMLLLIHQVMMRSLTQVVMMILWKTVPPREVMMKVVQAPVSSLQLSSFSLVEELLSGCIKRRSSASLTKLELITKSN